MTADDRPAPPALSISDHEIWACALHIMKLHGDDAPVYIAERIGALALAGDIAGVATWQRIAGRVHQLRSPSDVKQSPRQ